MEILAIDIGSISYQEYPAPEHWLGKETSGYSSYAHGYFHGGDFTTTTEEKNGVKSWSAKQSDARPLLIGIRLNDPSGRPMSIGRSYSQPWIHDDSRLEKRSGGYSGLSDWVDSTGDELAAHLRTSGVGMHVQHHDPDSGWVPLSGPLWIGEEHPGDHVLALSVWRRDLKTLKFRVMRESGEILEFQIPAPSTPARDLRTIAAETLPITRTGDGYTVRLEDFEIRKHDGSPPSVYALPMLESPRYTTGGERAAHLEGLMIGVRDESGNLHPFGLYHERKQRGLFQRHSPRLELLYQVRRNVSFPTPAADCLMIAEGVVSADGAEVMFTPLPGAARMGIAAVPAMPVKPSKDGFFHETIGEHLLRMRVEGEIDQAAMPGLFHGQEPSKLRLVVFREDEGESSGLSNFQGSGGASQSVNIHIGKAGGSRRDWKYYREDDWYAPKGGLAPGKRIRLALTPPLEDDLHVFPIEIPKDAFPE